ncbi:MAG: acyl-CoA synthetase [Gammaproteobacteria bacterium]|nr:acyl-CoA synthetase [Gammaproteobacteria bacterium]MYA67636.1 acyl-CoA synthetase [Gammaproteobacteria bacterium]MYE29153.1 acyl-CoA synthetase [Gammaproteobacteria bacterium]MYH46450.1 acyl-CoA synthetase [Gammaproteobacteria bacterium]MYL13382.1 acyl-CoA synthetase [Gammaproteobacteria bacterium]
MNSENIYEQSLDKNAANFAHLTPLSFIERCASVYPDRTSIVHGDTTYTWSQTYTRCCLLASALARIGIGKGDTVSFMGANTPETFEAHFGVPMIGAVLNALNTRLDPKAIAFILGHAETRVLFTDREHSATIKAALEIVEHEILVIDIDDPYYEGGELLGEQDYEAFIGTGDPDYRCFQIDDEWQAITLNYTSGTTGDPKGVVFHHRGAYLNAVSNVLCWKMTAHPVYLWTLPMFHCNGWCFPWSLAVVAGVNVCLRHVRDEAMFEAIKRHKVSHFCGAPVVLNTLINARAELREGIGHKVSAMTAGAAPPAAVIAGMENMGFEVVHAYGLTETYGPCVVCEPQDEWADLDVDGRAEMLARQGVRAPLQDELMVADPETLEPVPKDGKSMGEIFMRGNLVMKGYLKNPRTTEASFRGGWFHSGDLAVWYEDGYCQIKDRSKDIIISGGENISSLELESIMFRHPKILEAAVVASPDDKWGEVPCAFVCLKDGEDMTEQEFVSYCRSELAGFKMPKKVVWGPIKKTSTGKVQKYLLREQAKIAPLIPR